VNKRRIFSAVSHDATSCPPATSPGRAHDRRLLPTIPHVDAYMVDVGGEDYVETIVYDAEMNPKPGQDSRRQVMLTLDSM
jgi:hypothetical protein